MGLIELAVYLQLSPEFGGTRFGPFEDLEVRLGSNEDRCHIVLPPSFGVSDEHAKVIRQGPQNLILAPAERTATIFLWRAGARRPEQLSTPVAIRPGDSFSLVTPNGPRFEVQLDELPEEVKKAREEAAKRVGVGRRRLTKESMAAEGKRQIFTRLLVFGPMQMAQRALTFVRSGAIFQPRNVFLGVFILGGYILGGVSSCRNRQNRAFTKKITGQKEACENQLGTLTERGNNVEDWTFENLAGTLVGNQVETSLSQDQDLLSAVKMEARYIRATKRQYGYLFDRRSSQRRADFKLWRDAVNDSGALDDPTKLLVTWLAAVPEQDEGDFMAVENSDGETVCGRGQLRLSYRHATQLGLDALPDGYWEGSDPSEIEDLGVRNELLRGTLSDARQPVPDEIEGESVEFYLDGGAQCITLDGTDDRSQRGSLLRELEDQLGTRGNSVPEPELDHAHTMRMAAFWASGLPRMDLARGNMGGVDFADPNLPPTIALKQLGSGADWAKEQTARSIAKAMVLPCIALLEGDQDSMKGIFGDDGLPQPLPCLYLSYKLDQKQ